MPQLTPREAQVSQGEEERVREEEACLKLGKQQAKGQRTGTVGSVPQTVWCRCNAGAPRLADLLLPGAHALGIQVPVGVEVANGHLQVLHSDHRAVGQV